MIIDVSKHQGRVDWDVVKDQISGAILRCGYGSDIRNQDDPQWSRNVSECERLGIPYGVYLYSYANSEEEIQSEIQHTLRLLQGHTPSLPVFFDTEQKGTQNHSKEYALKFCETIKAAGYKAGIYTFENWWNAYIKEFPEEYPRWIAKFNKNNGGINGDKPSVPNVSIWQYTSNGHVNGIAGRVDCSIKIEELQPSTAPIENPPVKKSVDEIAQEVIDKKWGSGDIRKQLLTETGYDPAEVQAKVNELLAPPKKSIDEIAQEVIDNKWGSGEDRKNRLTAAGYNYDEVQAKVNDILKPAPVRKSIDEIAKEVVAGQWGAGNDRKNKLAQAGYDYNVVQAKVNDILGTKPAKKSVDTIAREVIAGKWGSNPARKNALIKAGYDYNAVQARVNQLLKK